MIPARPKAPPCAATPDLFTDEHPGAVARAKAICHTCPVAAPCLDYALAHEVEGVWAGASTKELRRLRTRPAA